MRCFFGLAVFGILALALAAPSSAGDKKKEAGPPAVQRGPEHKVLESLVGKFDAKVKVSFPDPAKPTESTGTMSRKMILDGNFLQESYKGDVAGQAFAGQGMIGFDPSKKQFVTTWADSMSISISIMHGSWDADKKTLTTVGEAIDPMSKKMTKLRDVLKIVSADEQVFAMYRHAEGKDKEIKFMEITYKRVAEKKKTEKK
jgi:hypothetical protein